MDCIAHHLGLARVGFIIAAPATQPRAAGLTGTELLRAARLQAQHGATFVTALVTCVTDGEGTPSVHFEAFQASDQAAALAASGTLVGGHADPKFVATAPERPPVVVAGRDVRAVEVEFLQCVVPILDHEGPLATRFPVENRVTHVAGGADLQASLVAGKALPYALRLADFHLLLFLSHALALEPDLRLLCGAVAGGGEVAEGYQFLINALAGL